MKRLSYSIVYHLFLIFLLTISFAAKGAAQSNSGNGHISGSIFEKHGGYIHGYLSVAEKYSDNILNTESGEKEDFVTLCSPGIWLSLPGGKERIPETNTSSITPGGVVLGSLSSPEFRRLMAYLIYSPEFEFYADNSDENTESHHLEASFQYRFRGGMTVGFVNQFVKTHDERGTGFTTFLDEYATNLVQAFVSYDLSPKLTLEGRYGNFLVEYDADRSLFRDRMDHLWAGSIEFRLTPKTAVFGEYEYTTVTYDAYSENDNDEHHFSAGWRWMVTGKSMGSVKAGYSIEKFNAPGVGDERTFILSAQINHRFTSKTSVNLAVYRRTNETDFSGADYMLTHQIQIGYKQKITSKIQLNVDAMYSHDQYEGVVGLDGQIQTHDDNYYQGSVGIDYAFKKWLTAGLEFTHSQRDTDFEGFDYTTNEVLFRITASL